MAIVMVEHYHQLCTLDLQALGCGLHFSIYFLEIGKVLSTPSLPEMCQFCLDTGPSLFRVAMRN